MLRRAELLRRIPLVRRPFWQLDVTRKELAQTRHELTVAIEQRDRARAASTEAVASRDASGNGLAALIDIARAHQLPRERKGRNVLAGNIRGWHIEFGNLLSVAQHLPDFRTALAACEGCNLLGDGRLLNLYLIIKFGLPMVPGDLIELGTYRGGSALFMASLLKSTAQEKVLYACDTFSGMPETNRDIDMHHGGDFADTSYDEITRRIDAFALSDHLVLVKGRFEDTLPALLPGKQLSLAHIDCDIYEAVRFGVDSIDLYLAKGAYVVFDDPLYSSCLGAMEAVEEAYVQQRTLHAEQAFPHLVFRPKGV